MDDADARKRALAWARGPYTGLSSLTIWHTLLDVPWNHGSWRPSLPRDPADLWRCLRLLDAVPEWRSRLDEVAVAHPEWRPLVREWDALVALFREEEAEKTGLAPRTYARMKELREEAPRGR